MTMNPDIKTRWLEALRSGEYPQTQGALNRPIRDGEKPAGLCCLGVLCELAVEDGIVRRVPYSDYMLAYIAEGAEYVSNAILPREVVDWAGLDTAYGLELDPEEDVTLTTLNDGGNTFAEIADVIEEHL